VYTLTERGRAALEGWFREPVEPIPPRHELLLKLFLGAHAPAGALHEQMGTYRERRARDLATLESVSRRLSVEARSDPEFPYWAMTVSAGIHAARAAVAWCDEVLESLEEGRAAKVNAETAS
jgi:hypothetical protein